MRFKLLAVLFLFFGFSKAEKGIAQYKLQQAFQIDTPAVSLSIDNLNNVYLITPTDQLLKYSSAGKLLWNYSNKAFGKLAYVDVTDPMRVLLFYPAIQQAVVLNNNLNEITRFNFAHDASLFISLIATANSNGFWVYDQLNQQIWKLTNQFGNELQSVNLYQQTGFPLQPLAMHASDQFVYIYDFKQGLLKFDRFGNYLTALKTGLISSFQVKGDTIFMVKDQQWNCYKSDETGIQTLAVFDEKVLQVGEGNKRLAVLTNQGVKIYSILNNEEGK
ncbi:hypothetical protein [Desertivirga arenae]|uniref:hypothetical protein n=1 Tax=Desertivirga arenae TaxID=2810309 RepID=UPI001A97A5B2|nr:hypothetical protein [Pedobacter sp. SYSU D00823]